jgi:phosphoglycolate phosphatase
VSVAARLAFEHVAVDLDGTLVDSRADLAAAVNHVLRTFRLPELPAATLQGYVGEGARALVGRALGADRGALLDEALARFLARYGEHLLDETRPYPGVVEALDVLRAAGARLSILTNKPVALSRRIVAGLGLASRFVAVVGGDSLPTRKPHPAGLDHLRATTGTVPARMLLVGDSDIDVATARAAGVAFCGVAWGLAPDRLAAARPERVIADPAALVPLVLGNPRP